MACYRCGTRQVDPARGHSPWQRGVRGDQQVLICPTCQGSHEWKADLDQCGQCGSVRLVRRLGEVECRDCGFVAAPEVGAVAEVGAVPGVGAVPAMAAVPEMARVGAGRDDEMPGLPVMSGAEAPGLSEEVARALDRVLGRGPGRG
jgi:hypothetical protein